MKNNIMRFLLSGALLAVSAQAAQKVNIQFPFRTPAGELPAGSYSVVYGQLAGGKYVQLRNNETKASVLIHPYVPVSNLNGTEKPRMIFLCGQSGCNLQRIWQDGITGYDFRIKRLTPAESERLAVVQIDTRAAE